MTDDRSPLEALNARGLTAKREYVRGLEQRRDPEALSLLVECLCDESWFLRDLAEQAFFQMGDEHAGPLLPLLEGGLWYTRLSAARLLGRLGFRPAVPALLELCDDANETTSLAARDALVTVARKRGASRLAHALRRIEPERRKRRLSEVAERDRAVAKNLERLMADADLMATEHPDRLVDPEGEGRAGESGGREPFGSGATKQTAAPVAARSIAATAPAPAPKPPVLPAPAPKSAVAPVPAPKPPVPPAPAPKSAVAPAPAAPRRSAAPKAPAPAIDAPASPKPPASARREPAALELELPAPAPPVSAPPSSTPAPLPEAPARPNKTPPGG